MADAFSPYFVPLITCLRSSYYKPHPSNLFAKKPITAITVLIERLTKEEYEVDDLSDLPNLIEAIRLQRSTGPTEAARAIRKKLYVDPKLD